MLPILTHSAWEMSVFSNLSDFPVTEAFFAWIRIQFRIKFRSGSGSVRIRITGLNCVVDQSDSGPKSGKPSCVPSSTSSRTRPLSTSPPRT